MKTTAENEPLVQLAEAIRILKADPETKWMPETSIRTAVAEGRVFSMRTPAGKFSRYFVRISDLKALFKETKNLTGSLPRDTKTGRFKRWRFPAGEPVTP